LVLDVIIHVSKSEITFRFREIRTGLITTCTTPSSHVHPNSRDLRKHLQPPVEGKNI
jgi:hypothetical protein